MKMFTELKRVYSNGYMNYVPKFQETFPELKHLTREELADRFSSLGIEFYTTERKPVPILIRLTMPFAFVTVAIMVLFMPLHYLITGRWHYCLKDNCKLFNWLSAIGL